VKRALKIESERQARTLTGEMDCNLKVIEQLTGVRVGIRGENVFLDGPPEKVDDVGNIITDILRTVEKGSTVTPEEVENLFRQFAKGRMTAASELISHSIVVSPRKSIVPKSKNQILYLEKIKENDIVFVSAGLFLPDRLWRQVRNWDSFPVTFTRRSIPISNLFMTRCLRC
jgi:phosphate starvation-inducible PhoH-like protein